MNTFSLTRMNKSRMSRLIIAGLSYVAGQHASATDVAPAIAAAPVAALAADPLSQLRDIRLPTPVSIWPLASGWWIVLVALVLCLVASTAFVLVRRRSVTAQAVRELNLLEQKFTANEKDPATIGQLSVLLRRFALRMNRQPGIAELEGAGWSQYLASGNQGLPVPLAQYIATAPYMSPDSQRALALPANQSWPTHFASVRRWLRQQS